MAKKKKVARKKAVKAAKKKVQGATSRPVKKKARKTVPTAKARPVKKAGKKKRAAATTKKHGTKKASRKKTAKKSASAPAKKAAKKKSAVKKAKRAPIRRPASAPPAKSIPSPARDQEAASGGEMELITAFGIDPERQAVIREALEHHNIGSPSEEWPNNILSRRAVVYASGIIARAGDEVQHAVWPQELDLCRRLAQEAKQVVGDLEVGMGSESGDTFQPFFMAANAQEAQEGGERSLTAELIRQRFGGTIFPGATITVEPLEESGTWWSEVLRDAGDEGEEFKNYLRPWRAMVKWFREQPDFWATAFVRIGDYEGLHRLGRDQYPPGTVLVPCVLPRLALGITHAGSLAGLFGVSVQT